MRWGVGALLAATLAAPAWAQQDKRAQTGMKFVSLSLDARGAALGDAMTALEGESAHLLYNPAGIARQQSFLSVSAGQVEWIADIDYNQATLTLAPARGRYGVFGFSLLAVDYGAFERTVYDTSDRGYIDLGTFDVTSISFGVGYARALTDRFSVGGHVKYIEQDLGAGHRVGQAERDALDEDGNTIPLFNDDGTPTDADGDGVQDVVRENYFLVEDYGESVVAYDFGVLYKTGFRSLNFAFAARNFAPEVTYVQESFELPIALKIGLSMDLVDLTRLNPSMHKLLLSVDAESPRDFDEQIKVGTEYVFLNAFALRAGYTYPTDEQGLTLGAGVMQRVRGFGFGADYAYTEFGVFGSVHRLAFRFSL